MYCATYLGLSGGENNDHVEVSLAANLKKNIHKSLWKQVLPFNSHRGNISGYLLYLDHCFEALSKLILVLMAKGHKKCIY